MGELISCKICNRECKNLRCLVSHLRGHIKEHSQKDYYDKFMKRNESEGICLICGKKTNFQSLKFGYAKHCSYKCGSLDLEVQKKNKETSIKKYNVDHPQKNKTVRNKVIATNIKNCGFFCNFQSEETKRKKIKTSQIHYSKDHPCQSEEVKKIRREIEQEKNIKDPNRIKKIIEKRKKTCNDKYGVDYYNKTIEGRQKIRSSFLKRIENQYNNNEPLSPNIGNKERKCLNELQKFTNYKIERNIRMFDYFPDGLIQNLKLIIEFDEKYHQNLFQKEKDYFKDLLFQKNGFSILRINENEWNNNKNKIINEFCNMVKYQNN